MPKFAKLDENDVVIEVNEVHPDCCPDEQCGVEYLTQWSGGHANWAQTTMSNVNPRKAYAGVGYKLDRVRDAFIPPQPFPSWVLNESTCKWESPVPYPSDGNLYSWNEATVSWQLVNI